MQPKTQIVHGGGWVKRQFVGKPKALLLTFVSVIWLAISFCASIPLWAGGPFSGLQWLCASLIGLEPVFIVATIAFWIGEPTRTVTKWRPNSDYKVRRLY